MMRRLAADMRFWLGILCAACLLAYARGLGGDFFLFDDFQNIVQSRPMQMLGKGVADWVGVMFLNATGPTRRPVSMLSFGLNVLAFGMNPPAFKAVNLLLHLANGALLYALLRRIVGRMLAPTAPLSPSAIALVTAGVWLLHPLHVSSVLYIIQRMNVLASTFMLAGLLCYAEGRLHSLQGDRSGIWRAIIGMGLLGVLAVFSKETGAMIIAYALIIECFCFRFEAPRRQKWLLQGTYLLGLALPLALYAAYLLVHPESLEWTRHGFTVGTRLLSEARVVCDYLLWTFVPLPSFMGIFHDDIAASTGVFDPPATAASIAFLVALALAAWYWRKRMPVLAFGITWFLVGHSLESTVLPLELVFEHRNYVPMIGPLLVAVCMLGMLRTPSMSARFSIAISCMVLLTVGALAMARANDWRSNVSMALADVEHHPLSSRSQYEAGRAIAVDAARRGELAAARPRSIAHIRRAAQLDAFQVAPAVALVMMHDANEAVPDVEVEDLSTRLRNARSEEQLNPFLDLLTSASEGNLSLARAQVAGLFEAAMANPLWPARVRAMMLNDYGAYQFNIVRNATEAIRLTESASRIDPSNAYFPLNLAKITAASGDFEAARVHLADAERMDKLEQYRSDIDDLRRSLRN